MSVSKQVLISILTGAALEAAGVEVARGRPWRLTAVEWSRVGLGRRPDAEIARDLGCHTSTVRGHRSRRGIAAPPRRARWYL